MQEDISPTQAHWLIPFYLAAHGAPNASLPTHTEVGVESVIETAKRCFDARGHANYLTVLNISSMRLADNPWREVFGLAGSIGESFTHAAGCEVEVELHRRARACGDLPEGMILGQRFFSDAEGHMVLGIGHRLLNLTLRALAIEPNVRAAMSTNSDTRKWHAAYHPFSNGRDAWVPLNSKWIKRLDTLVAPSPHQSIRDMFTAVADLQASAAWQTLDDSRGRHFHRWRPESSVLAGIDEQSGNVVELATANGAIIGRAVGTQRTRYSAADGLEEIEAKIARDALISTANATDRLLDALDRALEPLSEGHLIKTGRGISSRFGHVWRDADCTCCR